MNDPRQQQAPPGGASPSAPAPSVVQQTTVIQMGSRKSVAGAVLLALFFGPIGMIYATVVGALVMFVVNVIVIIPTLGLGLLLTIPVGAVWAGIAAHTHNSNLGAVSSQAVASGAAPTATGSPAGWHDDPDGSGRLRYWDGFRWTGEYAERPDESGPGDELTTTAVAEKGTSEIASSGTAIAKVEAARAYCESCGHEFNATDRFCPSCGERQATT